jgi:hypothetical protein
MSNQDSLIDVFPAYLALRGRYAGKFERKRGGCEEARPKVGASSASSVSSEEETEETEKSQIKLGAHAPITGAFIPVHSLRAIAYVL